MKENSPLDSLILTFPCPINWDTMEGDERERLCRQCDKKVYNISDMSKSDAEKLLLPKPDGSRNCVRFFLRADGTITTDECPRFLRPLRNSCLHLSKAVSMAMAFVMSVFTYGCSKGEVSQSNEMPVGQKSTSVDPRYGVSGEVGGGLGGDDLSCLLSSFQNLFAEQWNYYFHELPELLNYQRSFDFKKAEHKRTDCLSKQQYLMAFRLYELETAFRLADPSLKGKANVYLKGFEIERQRMIASLLENSSTKPLSENSSAVQDDMKDCLTIASFEPATSKFEKYALPYVDEFSYMKEGEMKTGLMSKANKAKFKQLQASLKKNKSDQSSDFEMPRVSF